MELFAFWVTSMAFEVCCDMLHCYLRAEDIPSIEQDLAKIPDRFDRHKGQSTSQRRVIHFGAAKEAMKSEIAVWSQGPLLPRSM